jgi:hypothetical protein
MHVQLVETGVSVAADMTPRAGVPGADRRHVARGEGLDA